MGVTDEEINAKEIYQQISSLECGIAGLEVHLQYNIVLKNAKQKLLNNRTKQNHAEQKFLKTPNAYPKYGQICNDILCIQQTFDIQRTFPKLFVILPIMQKKTENDLDKLGLFMQALVTAPASNLNGNDSHLPKIVLPQVALQSLPNALFLIIKYFNPNLNFIEASIISLNLTNRHPIIIALSKFPPSSDNTLFILDLENLIQIGSNVILCGDF
ncbi:hypothetical protein CEXT_659831 [Caerostris extrusa]|uniref:Uncharacterized protein n=1 Tax=Caerostris extrusa TaxID=172846 RepID=A0AAV4MBX9_CAEEX|nr:hypothetical protein CEXT_659831 [Caerostris extrusa]